MSLEAKEKYLVDLRKLIADHDSGKVEDELDYISEAYQLLNQSPFKSFKIDNPDLRNSVFVLLFQLRDILDAYIKKYNKQNIQELIEHINKVQERDIKINNLLK